MHGSLTNRHTRLSVFGQGKRCGGLINRDPGLSFSACSTSRWQASRLNPAVPCAQICGGGLAVHSGELKAIPELCVSRSARFAAVLKPHCDIEGLQVQGAQGTRPLTASVCRVARHRA